MRAREIITTIARVHLRGDRPTDDACDDDDRLLMIAAAVFAFALGVCASLVLGARAILSASSEHSLPETHTYVVGARA